jgi:hypothetical protein
MKRSNNMSFEKMVAGSSVDSSMCSANDNAKGVESENDYYWQSVMATSMVKEPEDLVDRDLLSLLSFIKGLKLPTEEQV